MMTTLSLFKNKRSHKKELEELFRGFPISE